MAASRESNAANCCNIAITLIIRLLHVIDVTEVLRVLIQDSGNRLGVAVRDQMLNGNACAF
jgi:hypothetical protein